MIDFFSETDFDLKNTSEISKWISGVITAEDFEEGDISVVFCDDAFLHKLNVEYLKHDTLTDIISFDYSLGKQIHGEIYISVERVRENALTYSVSFEEELHRVIIHGILHYCGYKDKSDNDSSLMRTKENEALAKLSTA
ncbi:rRNA maturation RNase YbeY [Ulvibacter sp. MAR_2010_11]|uniref:rRNA maturation RNase YbeY n=1 Tax=Ulvibacter sp. MAR_2010_11 TaxID=1250229 RepID=UPI000C2C9FAF|nr:rRNA maturation RNase YbeY [Ulvibacter sp. MAR_2010_11]PKA82935.1 rRNA maturation RNase YbeY [Ulvibacter sp. MAR_2010_11]